MKADYGVNLANWDYSMRFPPPAGEDDKPRSESDMSNPKVNETNSHPEIDEDGGSWQVDANGQLVAHMSVFLILILAANANPLSSKPMVTFGVVFDSSKISNAAVSLNKVYQLPLSVS